MLCIPYSGYENKVANDLVKTVENNGMGDLIQEVTVPIEEVVEIRNGKPHTIQHKLFPGYVLVKMIKTTETWYVVRNTRGVTGFVGPGKRADSATDEEYERMTSCQGTIRIDLEPGDNRSDQDRQRGERHRHGRRDQRRRAQGQGLHRDPQPQDDGGV